MKSFIKASPFIIFAVLMCLNFYPRMREQIISNRYKVGLSHSVIIANALESYYQEHAKYPLDDHSCASVSLMQFAGDFPLEESFYQDGWGNSIQYICTEKGQRYVLVAPNKNGTLDFDIHAVATMNAPNIIEDIESDIVYSDGVPFQYLNGSWGGDPFNQPQREKHRQIRRLKQALRRLQGNPGDATALSEKGISLSLLGYYSSAEPVLQEVIVQNPSNAEAWRELGRVWLNMEEFRKSNEAMEKAVELNPTDNQALILKGVLHLFQNQKEQAIRCFVSVREDDTDIRNDARWLVERLEEYANKDFLIEKVDHTNWIEATRRYGLLQDWPLARYKMAQIFYQLGKLEDAQDNLSLAVDKVPDFIQRANCEMPEIVSVRPPKPDLEKLLTP